MSRPSRLLAALAAVVVLAMPSVALAGEVTVSRSFTAIGTLVVVHADDFRQQHASFWYSLRTKSGTFQLDVKGRGPADAGGATVRVTGVRTGKTIQVDAAAPNGGVSVLAPAPAAIPRATRVAAAPIAKRIAVVLLNFSNDGSQPFTPGIAQSIVFDNGDSVANFLTEEARGRITVSGDVFGWYTIAATNDNCAWSTWGSQAQAAASAAGVDLNAYTNVVFAWPRTGSCGWAGLGYMPGRSSYNNGAFSLRVVAHELSHNLGVAHASSLRCMDGATPVSLSSSCTFSEYGDPFTVMGGAAHYHNQAEQIGEMGWLAPGEVATATPGASYELAPLLGDDPTRPKLVRVARGDGTWLYIDIRAPAGVSFDDFAPGSPAVSGLTIRMSPDNAAPTGSPVNSRLIDANPATSTFADAPLPVGGMLTDPVSHLTITAVAIDGDGAIVAIGDGSPPPDTSPPSAPSSLSAPLVESTKVKLTWGVATDDTGVTSYRVTRNGTVVATLGATTWTDIAVIAGTSYTYRVTAADAAGNRGPAVELGVRTRAARTRPIVRGMLPV
jgi:hypothetical protein